MKQTTGGVGFVFGSARFLWRLIYGISSLRVRIYFWLLGVKYGVRLKIRTMPFCRRYGTGAIIIGDDVLINNTTRENPAGMSHETMLIARDGATLRIGNRVGMSGAVLYACYQIDVEDDVLIGTNAVIYDSDHHPVDFDARCVDDLTSVVSKPVRICRGVWIGARATILKGVTIGERSIVGAGAVVSKSVPPDSIVVGNPAKVVKTLLSPDKNALNTEFRPVETI